MLAALLEQLARATDATSLRFELRVGLPQSAVRGAAEQPSLE